MASGEILPLSQEDIQSNGHAFEARIYAEDPENGFLPQAGTLKYLELPFGVRVDTGVRAGDPVPVFYDPLIAKLIVWGNDRPQALNRLIASLESFQVQLKINLYKQIIFILGSGSSDEYKFLIGFKSSPRIPSW